MVDSPQTCSPANTYHAAATMNLEKQNGVLKRRPPQGIATQSPKLTGRGLSLPKRAGSPAINGSSVVRRESQFENNGLEDSYGEDIVATPVKAFLSSNVTPRSGSRKARAETASPTMNGTPDGTPCNSRPVSSNERHERRTEDARATSGLGLRLSNAGRRSRTSSIVSDGPGSVVSTRPVQMERRDSSSRVTSPENAPKFFHANDVKSTVPSRPISERSLPQGRLPGHAQSKGEKPPDGSLSSFSNSPTSEEQKSKFFFTNDPNESIQPPLKLANGSRPTLQTIYSAHTTSSPPRAPSPLKEEFLPRKPSISKASPRRHTRLVSNGGSELKSPEAVNLGNGNLSRRSSLNSHRQTQYSSHARASSVSSAGPSPPRRSSMALSDTSPIERTRTASLVGANGALPHSVNPPSTTQELPPSQPQSPTKSTASGRNMIDQMNDLAANARRERKVLDLEISNSSLLAINRTLERELRKQSAELRRFRRLSRSGRMSIAPSRSASGNMSRVSETETNIDSDDLVSSEDDDDDPTDLVSNSSLPSAASQVSSPTPRAARTRFQDPKPVELDLAAHRALLLDSQKLNSSIKRCLSHSERLISSGKQAVEYQAQAPEPGNLGARVLTPDEVEDEVLGQGQGLLSPSLVHAGSNPWERSLSSMRSLDSGLETPDYSTWGLPTEVQTPFADISDQSAINGAVQEAVDIESHRTKSERDLPVQASQNQTRRVSEIASIDGLEDGSDSERLEDEDSNEPIVKSGNRPQRQSVEERILTPGYRGSMQGLGHYLQAFSVFGTSQQT